MESDKEAIVARFRQWAWELVEQEVGTCADLEAITVTAEKLLVTLHQRLAQLVGASGSLALLARAIELATDECPFLREAAAAPGRYLEELSRTLEERSPSEAAYGLVTVLANMMSLLSTLVGEEIVLRLLGELRRRSPEQAS